SKGRVRGRGRERGILSNSAAIAPPPHPSLSPRGEEIKTQCKSSAPPLPLGRAVRLQPAEELGLARIEQGGAVARRPVIDAASARQAAIAGGDEPVERR